MYHSITFIDSENPTITHNTWDDWHLIPSSRPVIKPPAPATKFVEIPGRNGSLDLSDVALGFPTFKDRSGSLEFYVDHDSIENYRWFAVYSEVMHYIHGRVLKMVLEDDPGYYYEGRFTVNDWASDKTHSKITINYQVGPFKKELVAFNEPWEWDSFNFRTGVISDSGIITAPYTFDIFGSIDPVEISFTPKSGANITIVYSWFPDANSNVPKYTQTETLHEGVNTFDDIFVRWGKNTIAVEGEGGVTILYRGDEF